MLKLFNHTSHFFKTVNNWLVSKVISENKNATDNKIVIADSFERQKKLQLEF